MGNLNAIDVVGIGLDGAAGLSEATRELVATATVLAGSDRHLHYFPELRSRWLEIGNLSQAIALLRGEWERGEQIVLLATGDPLFFGIGRLLLAEFPPEALRFHPHLCSMQLAFSALKMPWQDASFVSAHGRSPAELTQALKQGCEKICLLTDANCTPATVILLLQALDLPFAYELWLCENLGDKQRERVLHLPLDTVPELDPAPLNVVVLLRQDERREAIALDTLPVVGLPDRAFLSFRDRPGLITKREVRLAILGELDLRPRQIIWDLGAGTGSVAIEVARLCPEARVYALEKTAMGVSLIEQNCQRLQVPNVEILHGTAPNVLPASPPPQRIFIGGSGGNLAAILTACATRLAPEGKIVLAIATVENLGECLHWFRDRGWFYRLLHVQISRSVPIGSESTSRTRFSPLNPVTLAIAAPNLRD